MATVGTSDSQAVAYSTCTAMVVVGESVGDKRKHDQIAESETSSVTGDVDKSSNTPLVEDHSVPPATQGDLAQAVVASASPQTFSSHCSLREHLIEENRKQAQLRRQL